MKKQIKVTLDKDLYNLISKKCMEELGELNLSLYTRILYKKELKKVSRETIKEEMKKLRNKGLTYGEIGEIYSMSRQAIHQKLKK